MTEPQRAEEFREAIAKIPARSFKPSKKQAVSGLTVLLLIAIGAIKLFFIQTQAHHRVDDTAYLQCIAQQETAAQDPTNTGFPEADASFGVPSAAGPPVSDGEALALAASACASLPH